MMFKVAFALIFFCFVLNTNAAYSDESLVDPDTQDSGFPIAATFATPYSSTNSTKIGSKPFIAVSYVLLRENNDRYLESIKKMVKANWQPPGSILTTSIVSLEINKNGEMIDVKSILPSGNLKYDQAALKAVFQTHRFIHPPANLQLPVAVTITFNSDPRLADNEWASRYHPTPWEGSYLLAPH